MGKIGIIASIPLSDNGIKYEGALGKAGLSRSPGTGQLFLPHKERNGEYRTGLDAEADYIRSIPDSHARKIEVDKVSKERARLETDLKISLDSRSEFYNISTWSPRGGNKLVVEPIKLMDGNNYFNLEDPVQAVSFMWLRVHPQVAMSFEAYRRGDYPNAKFYVKDDEVEQEITYRKKVELNKAINILDNILSLEKRKKVARQCSLPIGEDDKEGVVYNHLDSFIKSGAILAGPYEGNDPVEVFMRFVNMSDDLLNIKDLVKQAIYHSIYREDRMGRIYEGQREVAKSEADMVDYLRDEKNQSAFLLLEDQLKAKKSMLL